MYTCVHIHVCSYTRVYIYTCVHIHVCSYTRVFIYTCAHIHVCSYTRVCQKTTFVPIIYSLSFGPVVSREAVRGEPRSQIATHHVTRHYMPIHNILLTAPKLSISQKALRTLPDDGNEMPKHLEATIHN
jgi:hypothetical protein